MTKKEIPYFLQMKGCINCEASKRMNEKNRKYGVNNECGFDHEIVLTCMFMECVNHGYDISRPFINPDEVMERAKASGNPVWMENAKKYTKTIRERFGGLVDKAGIVS